MTDFAQLAAPFPADRVTWRVGPSNKKKRQRETKDNNAKATKGQALAYIDARDVMERLDEICGPAGWQCRYPHAAAKTVCEIGIRTDDGEWIWKSDGAGDTDMEAVKGSLSDAFKRAAVRWGIGRYLYDLPTPWVDLDDWERIPESELKRLAGMLTVRASADAPKAPERNKARVADMTKGIADCKTADALKAWRLENDAAITLLHPEDRNQVGGIFRAQENTIKLADEQRDAA